MFKRCFFNVFVFLQLHDIDKADSTGNYSPIQRENPRKYLLYKPSFSQSLTYLSAAFKDLPPHSVLLIYISADACEAHGKSNNDGKIFLNLKCFIKVFSLLGPYDRGGVHTNNKRELTNQSNSENKEVVIKKSSLLKDSHCIYPGDLFAFTRKPLFLIVDSPNSVAFQVNHFFFKL